MRPKRFSGSNEDGEGKVPAGICLEGGSCKGSIERGKKVFEFQD